MMRLTCLIATLAVLLLVDTSFAQQPSRYTQRRPTLSPYLNLLRPTYGGLPSYYAFVRPMQQQGAVNQQQAQIMQRQQQMIQQLENQRIVIGQTSSEFVSGTVPTGSGSGFMTPGSTGYMNYSHYYPARRPLQPRQ